VASRLIVFAGPACSGKSTLAARLSEECSLPHLSMDTTRARLLPASAHTRADRAVAYRAMHWAFELLARQGKGAILDAPYGHREDRLDLEAAAFASGAALFLVECMVSAEGALTRFHRRARGARLDLTAEAVHQMASAYPFCGRGLALDTTARDEDECMEMIRRYLGSGMPVPPGGWSGA
jgi:predicted kinase